MQFQQHGVSLPFCMLPYQCQHVNEITSLMESSHQVLTVVTTAHLSLTSSNASRASSLHTLTVLLQDVAPEDRKSFGECYRCFLATRWCDELTDEEKDAFGGCEVHKVPHIPQLPVLQYGLYAAQLSWWLSFFPPERFMILRQEDTKDPEKALEVS